MLGTWKCFKLNVVGFCRIGGEWLYFFLLFRFSLKNCNKPHFCSAVSFRIHKAALCSGRPEVTNCHGHWCNHWMHDASLC